MQVSQTEAIWLQYQKANSRRNTLKAYRVVLPRFCQEFGDRGLNELTSKEILSFLNRMTEAPKQPLHVWPEGGGICSLRLKSLKISFSILKNSESKGKIPVDLAYKL